MKLPEKVHEFICKFCIYDDYYKDYTIYDEDGSFTTQKESDIIVLLIKKLGLSVYPYFDNDGEAFIYEVFRKDIDSVFDKSLFDAIIKCAESIL